MDKSRREDLLGYLIGALEKDENQKVRHELEQNETTQLELVSLRKELCPLTAYAQWSNQLYQPPQNLAERTCNRIWDRIDSGLADSEEIDNENVLNNVPNGPGLPIYPAVTPPKRIVPRTNMSGKDRQESWKLSDLITVACVGIMLLFLAYPVLQFVKTQVVQIVVQHKVQKLVDNTAVISQFQDDIPFFQRGVIADKSEYVYSSGTDLGSLLASFGETNLSQKTLEYFSPNRIEINNAPFSLKIPGAEHHLITIPYSDLAGNSRSQYVQSTPFPHISSLFAPNSLAFPVTPQNASGFTLTDWGKTPTSVFSEAGKAGPSGAFVKTNDVQHIFFRDGRVFFRKTGFSK